MQSKYALLKKKLQKHPGSLQLVLAHLLKWQQHPPTRRTKGIHPKHLKDTHHVVVVIRISMVEAVAPEITEEAIEVAVEVTEMTEAILNPSPKTDQEMTVADLELETDMPATDVAIQITMLKVKNAEQERQNVDIAK